MQGSPLVFHLFEEARYGSLIWFALFQTSVAIPEGIGRKSQSTSA